MKNLTVLFFLALISPVIGNAQIITSDPYPCINGKSFIGVYHGSGLLTWNDANDFAINNYGGTLACVNDAEEFALLSTVFTEFCLDQDPFSNAWIGGKRDGAFLDWYWIDGSVPWYEDWDLGSPSTGTEVALDQTSGLMVDESAGTTFYSFIIQIADPSCLPVEGCTNPGACNYDMDAEVDDGSCIFPDGCTDPVACNYDPSATCNDGSCISGGCNDPNACNYDPAAPCDDGSCILGPPNDVCENAEALSAGISVVGTNIGTCVDGPNPACGGSNIKDVWYTITSSNGGELTITTSAGSLNDTRIALYDGCSGTELTCNDDYQAGSFLSQITFTPQCGSTYLVQVGGYQSGTGTFDIVYTEAANNGCSDPAACNYEPCAVEDGTCNYSFGCSDPLACNFDPAALCDDGSCGQTALGSGTENFCVFDLNGTCAIEGSICDNGTQFSSAPLYSQALNYEYISKVEVEVMYAPLSSVNFDISFNGNVLYSELNSAPYLCNTPLQTFAYQGVDLSGQVPFANSLNFSWDADILLSAILVTVYYGKTPFESCTNPEACNYNSAGTCDDGSCILPDGCTNPSACNYDPTAVCDDGSCIGPPGCTDPAACNYDAANQCDDGSCVYPGCTNISACNYDPTAACDDGSCEYLTCRGCTGQMACNYDPTASIDDGSCDYSTCAGCTYPSSPEFDPSASIDDGSCTIEPSTCQGDFNGDNQINTTDVLAFLSVFGQTCN